MRVHLKGIHRVHRRLATGKIRTHWYAWRGGPPLTGRPGSSEFIQSYTEAHAARRKPAEGRFSTLIAEFKASSEYLGLSDTTKRAYTSYLKMIEGNMPIEVLSDSRVRGEFKAWRDQMADKPRKADYAWTTLTRVLSVAKDRGRIPVNHCERGGRLYQADRTDKLWTESDLARLLSVASPEMELIVLLALGTGQRQGDLLRLRWSDYDGTYIRLRQSKTGQAIVVRIGGLLKAGLDATQRRGPMLLTNTRGRPWTSDGFRTSWAKLCQRAGINDLTFHDLRGSAVTRLALAGATPQEIAGVTGHSLRDVSTILDRHYLGDRAALAENAIRRLERKERRTKTVNRV
jgi:integrase